MNPLLVTMRGPSSGAIRMQDLSNFEAGYLTLSLVARQNPGLKWGDLIGYANQRGLTTMGKAWYEKLASGVGDFVSDSSDWVGDSVKDVFGATGGFIGDAVRMLTDKEVIDGMNSSYESFTSSGGVAGAVGGSDTFGIEKLFSGGDGKDGATKNQIMEWITSLGDSVKKKSGDANLAAFEMPGGVLPWALAGGAVVVLMLFRGGRK